MDLTQLANLGEFIGGVAVLVTPCNEVCPLSADSATFRGVPDSSKAEEA